MNYNLINKLSDTEESLSPAVFFGSKEIMTMSSSTRLISVKNYT